LGVPRPPLLLGLLAPTRVGWEYRLVPKLMFLYRLWTGGSWETMAQVSQTLAQEKPFNRLWHTTQTLDKGLFLRVFSHIIVIFTIFHLLPLALALVIHGTEYAFGIPDRRGIGIGRAPPNTAPASGIPNRNSFGKVREVAPVLELAAS
jgi:hypothetical protein